MHLVAQALPVRIAAIRPPGTPISRSAIQHRCDAFSSTGIPESAWQLILTDDLYCAQKARCADYGFWSRGLHVDLRLRIKSTTTAEPIRTITLLLYIYKVNKLCYYRL
jgi:hypothetical protein